MHLWSWSLASSIPVLGLERFCPRKGCLWPCFFFVSLASSLVSLIPPLLIALIFIKVGLKLSFFAQKNFVSSAGGSNPHTLCLQWLGALPPDPNCLQWLGDSPPDPGTLSPYRRFLATGLYKEKFTARYCQPPFILPFRFKYAWNVWRRCSHSQTMFNTAKSISPGNTYAEKLSQKILSPPPTPLWSR